MSTTTDTLTERDRWFLGTLLRIRVDRHDTAGQLAIMEQHARRGFSPPLHVHHGEDTALLVLEGAITAVVGDRRTDLGPGGFVWLPRDVPHTFRVDSETVRQLELVMPAGFERFHMDTSGPAGLLEIPPPSEPDIPRLVDMAAAYDAEVIGPPLGPED